MLLIMQTNYTIERSWEPSEQLCYQDLLHLQLMIRYQIASYGTQGMSFPCLSNAMSVSCSFFNPHSFFEYVKVVISDFFRNTKPGAFVSLALNFKSVVRCVINGTLVWAMKESLRVPHTVVRGRLVCFFYGPWHAMQLDRKKLKIFPLFPSAR